MSSIRAQWGMYKMDFDRRAVPSPRASRLKSYGRGNVHGDNVLPPTLQAIKSFTSVITSYITAEAIIGNLHDLQESHRK